MSPEDTEYYRQRAETELQMAEMATNPSVAAIHHQPALQYAARAATLDMGEESHWQGFMLNGGR